MMRKTIVLLIVTALMIPAVVAEPAKYESGTCSLTDFPLANRFAGEGEFKQVSTSSVDMHYECHGQLFEYSSVPNEAILISYDNFPLPGSGINYVEEIKIIITPSGLFTVIKDHKLYVQPK